MRLSLSRTAIDRRVFAISGSTPEQARRSQAEHHAFGDSPARVRLRGAERAAILARWTDNQGRPLRQLELCERRAVAEKHRWGAASCATMHKADSLQHGGHEDSSTLLCLRRSNQVNSVRRELLNGLLVLVVASLLSVAFSAFQVSFNAQLWVLILMGLAIAVTGYILFEITLGVIRSAEDREKEWLKRVGTPALLDLNTDDSRSAAGVNAAARAVKAMNPGSDLTLMVYINSRGGRNWIIPGEALAELFTTIMDRVKRGTIREYRRILCFDHDAFATDHQLNAGILRVGEEPGTIHRAMGEHCRWMLGTKGCFLYVAPVMMRAVVGLYGPDKAGFSFETIDPVEGERTMAGVMMFSDPPNGEIIEQLRQLERATERRMVAVREVRFPEDATPVAGRAALSR
jgi:hypothetical protein